MQTLYTALEGALTLIHPFMPFLSEELWQRLPRRPNDKTPSIVIAAYPQYDETFDDSASEEAYQLLIDCSQGIRSLKSEFSIATDANITIQAFDSGAQKTAQAEVQSIRSLSGKGGASISVLGKDDPVPSGCAVYAVSSAVAVYLEVKGRVDIQAEIKKLQTKVKGASDTVVKQRKVLEAPGFADNVNEAVFELENAKLKNAQAEQSNYEKSLEQFEKMKLDG